MKTTITLTLSIFSLIIIMNTVTAQVTTNTEFIGKVLIDNKRAKDVLVKVYNGNKCISKYTTVGNGKIIFTGGVEKHYTLEFEKEGYVTKRIIIKTHGTKYLDGGAETYKFDINLVKKEAGINYDDYDFPVAIIELTENKNEFGSNEKYAKNRQMTIGLNDNDQLVAKHSIEM